MNRIGMGKNPQSGSASSSTSDDAKAMKTKGSQKLPPLFLYMETGDWVRATQRIERHPREVKAWASIRSKSAPAEGTPTSASSTVSSSKRLALHHACFKLRQSVTTCNAAAYNNDPFIEVCKFIILLVEKYPAAASLRESKHGCLPLHLAAFASCTLPSASQEEPPNVSPSASTSSTLRLPTTPRSTGNGGIARPSAITQNLRSVSESTTETVQTTMSAALAEEFISGNQTDYIQLAEAKKEAQSDFASSLSVSTAGSSPKANLPTMSVSMGANIFISEKREEWAVKVLNALLDAFPRAIRMDSEGGRLPLHTACAGRATPRVVSTLLTASPAAARHRNKDGFLPLHLAAHWGISHPNVAVALLKAYPDATFGRNRWERTPLEEALCMAGENGRPHQAALVRALRKHPSYWTRPTELIKANSPRLVDIDETLPSDSTVPTHEDESSEGDEFGNYPDNFGLKERLTMFRKGNNGEVEVVAPATDLPTLIRSHNWEGVMARLEMQPSDAAAELQVTTRGGFTSSTGYTPLHYACERRPPVEVIDALIKASPNSACLRAMPGGALPLHVACTWDASVEVVNTLIRVDRATCKTHDELGNLPLHAACFSGVSTSVLDSLLRSYPKATLSRNHQGSLPEEITKRLRHNNRRTVITLLDVCKEEVLSRREKKHRKNRVGFPTNTNGQEDPKSLNPQSGGDKEELMWI